jgi:hypothetical protein
MHAINLVRTGVATVLLVCSTAQAQLFRAYLAADGTDANPCTLPAPCRLLPAALAAVANGGEIWMLDSANYNTGTVTIGKSVSILAVPGVVGSIVALNGGPAVSITAAGLNVALRNVVVGPVAGAAPGTNGIRMTGASNLIVEDSVFANLPDDAVRVTGSGTAKLNRVVVRNTDDYAVRLENGASATILGSQLFGNLGGVFASSFTTAPTTATVSDTVISGGDSGVIAHAQIAGATARISVACSAIERTNAALRSTTSGSGSAEVNFGDSLIVENNFAWYQDGNGSAVLSLGNNQMSGNAGSYGHLTAFARQ